MTDLHTKSDVMVSVCMITYNHAKYIHNAIEGVLLQETDFKTELVIGEDNSDDNTYEICKEYEQKFTNAIRLLPSEKNMGMIPNFIRTLKECKGKYIAICEGDDYWTDPYKLKKQVDFLEAHPDYGLVHTDVDVLFQDTGVLIQRNNFTKGWEIREGDVFELLLKGIFIRTLTVLMRKEIVDKYYNEILYDKWTLGDFPLFLFISKHSKIGYFNYATGVYRILKKSATHQISFKDRAEFLKGYNDIALYFAEKYGCRDSIMEALLRSYNERKIEIGFYELNNKDAREGFDFLRRKKMLSAKYLFIFLGSKNRFLQKLFFILLRIKKYKRILVKEN